MTQRLAVAATAGLIAFLIVLLSAVGAYIVLAPPTPPGLPVSTSRGDISAQSAPAQEQTAAGSAAAPGGGAATGSAISADDAATIALNNAPGATLSQHPRLVNLNGSAAYEVPLDIGFVYVDAGNGQILYDGTGGVRRRFRP